MSIMFGGDAESFMEAPRMENKSLTETMGLNPIAAVLDLVGIHRQVAKEPKPAEGDKSAKDTVFQPAITTPSVLNDVATALSAPVEVPVLPVEQDSAMTPWGKKWLESNKPLMSVDPDDFLL